jgi:hypothetical protein
MVIFSETVQSFLCEIKKISSICNYYCWMTKVAQVFVYDALKSQLTFSIRLSNICITKQCGDIKYCLTLTEIANTASLQLILSMHRSASRR